MKEILKTIRIKQTSSSIRCNKKQGLYLKSLGVRGIGSEVELVANNSVLKLIEKVSHLVKIV